MSNYTEFSVLSIDAWRTDYSWSWNQWYTLEHGLVLGEHELTPRKILKIMRDKGYLSEYSKGKLSVDDDGYNIVIQDKNTLKPLFALCYGEHEQ